MSNQRNGLLIFFSDGITVSSAFNFHWDNYEDDHLTDQKRAEYRNNLQNLELIIIDEMSLLTSDYLYRIHKRLHEIFQIEDPFANKSIVLVGDLLQLPPIVRIFKYSSLYFQRVCT